MSVSDKVVLRKRAIIETINDELKNIAQVEALEVHHPFLEVDTAGLTASHEGVDDGCTLGRIMVSAEQVVLSARATGRTLFSMRLSRSLDNLIEGAIRVLKVKAKVSGCFRTERGACYVKAD